MQHYPNNLRELRKAKGLLQIEVAQLLGHLNSDRISDWEKGYGMPNVVNLFKLASILGVTPGDLYPEIRETAERERFAMPRAKIEAKLRRWMGQIPSRQ